MSKKEENYLQVITIIQQNDNNSEDYSEIIEYEPENGENEVVYEYIELEEDNHQNETIATNSEDIQLLQINKQESIVDFQTIVRTASDDKFKCSNRLCKKNNVAFDTKELLDHHNEMHAEQFRNSICPICNKVLANQTKLTNHMQLRHTPKNYTCDQCGKVFRSKDNLRLHMSHHRRYFYVECRACNRGYKSVQSLRYHLRQHFEHHQCEACGR
jgi:hypothetical protein